MRIRVTGEPSYIVPKRDFEIMKQAEKGPLCGKDCLKHLPYWLEEVKYGEWVEATLPRPNNTRFPHRLITVVEVAYQIKYRMPHARVLYRHGIYGIRGDVKFGGSEGNEAQAIQAFLSLRTELAALAHKENARLMQGGQRSNRWHVSK